MIRLVLLVLTTIVPQIALAQAAQNLFPVTFGIYGRPENGGTNTETVNSAASLNARGFMLSDAKTISSVRLYCASKTGTPASTDIHVMLMASDTDGFPVASATEDRTLTTTPSCPGWIDATGFSTALSPHTQYWIVTSNSHGTPGSNYLTLNRISMEAMFSFGSAGIGGSAWGWNKAFSSDSGVTYAAGNSSGTWSGMRICFSDGTCAGFPAQDRTKEATEAYGTREVGAYFVVPSDGPSLRVRGVSMTVSWIGTAPTGGFHYRIRTGSTPGSATSTQTVARANAITAGSTVHPAYFSSPVVLAPGDVVRLTVHAVSDGGSSGNAWQVNRYAVDTDASSQALIPYSARMTSYNGSAWTEDSGKVIPFTLLLDSNDPYDVAAGAGRRINFSGGFRQ